MEIIKLFGKVFSAGAAVSEKGRSSSDTRLPDGNSKILRLYVFGPFLRYATLQNFAIRQP